VIGNCSIFDYRSRFCDGAVQGVRMTKPSYNEDSDLIFPE